jgi:hypothetical protein
MEVVVDEVWTEEAEEFAGAVVAAVGGAIEFEPALAAAAGGDLSDRSIGWEGVRGAPPEAAQTRSFQSQPAGFRLTNAFRRESV